MKAQLSALMLGVISLQVATIHDCLIHPDVQGCGVGQVLIKKCVHQASVPIDQMKLGCYCLNFTEFYRILLWLCICCLPCVGSVQLALTPCGVFSLWCLVVLSLVRIGAACSWMHQHHCC
jgi:hypothetical protein